MARTPSRLTSSLIDEPNSRWHSRLHRSENHRMHSVGREPRFDTASTHSRPSRLNSSIENDPAARLNILYLVPASCPALTRFHFYWTSRSPRRFAVEAPARGAEPSVSRKGRDAVRRKLSDPLCFCRRHGAAPKPSLITAECLNPGGYFGYIAAAQASSLPASGMLPSDASSAGMRSVRSGPALLSAGGEDLPQSGLRAPWTNSTQQHLT
jgi:hypothetical protein